MSNIVRIEYPALANGPIKNETFSTGTKILTTRTDQKAIVEVQVSTEPIKISTGPLDDIIVGGDSEFGDDTLDGSAGNDYVDGKAGNDNIVGGDGEDTLLGSAGNDSLNGGIDNDALNGGDGNDAIDGGDGNDTLTGGIGNDTLTGGIGNDFLEGGDGDDFFEAGDSDDIIVGNAGNDTMVGGAGSDTMVGGDGDDVLEIGAGDSVAGNLGTDTFLLDLSQLVNVSSRQAFNASNPPIITDFESAGDKIAISGEGDGALSYDMATGSLLYNGQAILKLDGNVALTEENIVNSTGSSIPVEVIPAVYKLSGTVYNDTNEPDQNKIEDIDAPIAGVEVKLFAADGTTLVSTATTDANGFYEFTNLADGDYVVTETQPAGYDSVTDKDGGDSNQISAKIAGADSVGNDFLEEVTPVKPPVLYKLSGTVYNDTNAPDQNTIEDTDAPIAGVEVKLYAADGTTLINTATTNANGFYEFTNLADGNYVIKETQPAGYDSVTDKDGGNPDEIVATISGADSLGNHFLEEVTSVDPVDPVDPTDEPTKVYQFVNPSLGSYFYTVDEYEQSVIAETLDNYELQEVEAIRTLEENEVDPITGAESEEVYRLFNKSSGSHLYTTSEFERDSIVDNFDNYSLDDNMFYAYTEEVAGSIDVHRFYNATEDVHVFTHSDTEIAEMMADSETFNDEGIAFYVMPDAMS